MEERIFTMIIQITKSHKSIDAPLNFELQKFTVLTGKNGSGKTQLFESISRQLKSGRVQIDHKVHKNIKFITYNGLSPQIDQSCDLTQIINQAKTIWTQFNRQKNQ